MTDKETEYTKYPAQKNQQVKSRVEVANETLTKAKDKFDEIVIVGIKNGQVDIAPSIPTYQFCQHMLSRAVFELNISEKAQFAAEAQIAAEADKK